MQWNSLSDFLHMGGYGLYVWGSFGVCAAAMLLEPILLGRRRRAILHSLRRHAIADRMDKESS